jgi:putative tryptophan/tyrosine transport system substrate-binding protein
VKDSMKLFSSESLINTTLFVLAVCAMLAALRASSEAQGKKKIPMIGILSGGSATATARQHDAFRNGLGELGWISDKNIALEFRYADGKPDRLASLAQELVRNKVDVIVAAAIEARRAAKQATTTVPIVMAQSGDPIAEGFVASLAQPGSNITGLTTQSTDTSGKRLELVKEVVPGVSRVVVLWNPSNSFNALIWKETENAARSFNIRLQSAELRAVDDLEKAFALIVKDNSEALFVTRSPLTRIHAPRIIDFAVKNRLPTMYDEKLYVEDGGLMSYGTDLLDLFRRAAFYVDKILKGAKPADLPVEQPTKFELVINLNTAKQIGLTIPPNVLARADRVIR